MKKNLRYVFLTIMIITAMVFSCGCDLFIKTNDGTVDLNWYTHLTYDKDGKDVVYKTSTGDSVCAVALEDDYSSYYGIIKGNEAYVNIDTLKTSVDQRFYWDKKGKAVIFTNESKSYSAPIGKNNITGDTSETTEYMTSFIENNKLYINVKFIKKFRDMSYKVTKGSGKTPTIITLKYAFEKKTTMSLDSSIEMRTKGNYQNLIVTKLDKGTKVTLIKQSGSWSKVVTTNGYIGYVPSKELSEEGKTFAFKDYTKNYTHTVLNKKVNLAWHQITNQTANGNLANAIAKIKGVNVISPTWFSLADKNGNLNTLADLNYVEKAHKNGLQVWGLVNDFSSRKTTKAVLENTTARKQLVRSIMFYLSSYELDGINVDFEYITTNEIDSYLQFLRELSVECRSAKKVLSIDNYAPTDGTEYYNREHQALVADYLIVMNYDEHTIGSKEAGSVSSLSFAEKGLKDTIAEAGDASRVIGGIPLYTRLWCETPEKDSDGSGTYITDAANGNYYLTSSALGMDDAKTAYKDAKAKPKYDSTTGQNYVTYTKKNKTYQMWLEDKTSIAARLDLMNKYKAGGAAYWALGFETDDIWDTVEPYFK